MNYAVADIVKDVRITLDQNQVESILAADDDTLELDDIIRKKITEAAMRILREAPLRMIDGTVALPEPITIEDEEEGGSEQVPVRVIIRLPDDYLRLAVVRMSDWETPLRVAVLDTSDIYQTVTSEFDGIRPNEYRPLAVETEDADGPILELWGSSDAEATLMQGRYIGQPRVRDGVLNFPKLLYDALVNMTAALTAQAYKDNSAQSLMQLAVGYMGIQPDK
jgi:hypothetical protein